MFDFFRRGRGNLSTSGESGATRSRRRLRKYDNTSKRATCDAHAQKSEPSSKPRLSAKTRLVSWRTSSISLPGTRRHRRNARSRVWCAAISSTISSRRGSCSSSIGSASSINIKPNQSVLRAIQGPWAHVANPAIVNMILAIWLPKLRRLPHNAQTLMPQYVSATTQASRNFELLC